MAAAQVSVQSIVGQLPRKYPKHPTGEPELIAAALAGDQDAFTALYKQHLPHVRAVAWKMLRSDDVEDVCQETFLLAFTQLETFRGGSKFRTWITRIAMNQCLMVLRRNAQVTNGSDCLVRLDCEGEENQPYVATDDPNLRAVPARLDLARLLGTLKPRQRRIVEMAYLDKMDQQEIADRCGRTLAGIKGTLFYARGKLRLAACDRHQHLRQP